MSKQNVIASLTLAVVFVILAIVFMRFFESFPTQGTSLGIDNIFYELDGWNIHYTVTEGLRNPPWSILPLVPVASLLSGKSAWGLLVFLTLVVTIASVPCTQNRRVYWLSILLAVLSFPTLRNLVDANLEGLVIAGVLLIVGGYRRQSAVVLTMGVLLATAKPQSVSLLIIVLALYVLRAWPMRRWLTSLLLLAVVVIPMLAWRGAEWLAAVQGTYQAGGIIDIGLAAALNRTGIVSSTVVILSLLVVLLLTLAIVWHSDRTLTRNKATFLLCASMLVAPYVAGNSIATILAIGLIPLLQERPSLGVLMIALVNLPFFWSPDWLYAYQAYWWTLILLLTWGITGYRLFVRHVLTEPVPEQPALATSD